jgi:hypothetical protein
MDQLVIWIKDISVQFAKIHYDKYLEDHGISKIPDNAIESVVDSMWTQEKRKQLSEIIRKVLKGKLKEKYSSTAVETIIMEMFEDVESSKQRIILEIETHQYQNKK